MPPDKIIKSELSIIFLILLVIATRSSFILNTLTLVIPSLDNAATSICEFDSNICPFLRSDELFTNSSPVIIILILGLLKTGIFFNPKLPK